ncbi:DUF4282 domain-containing protein [Halomonas sp. CS7]|uniref:DUF4282 domain-containing protein n=1 Tax=Halomonas pelophila TaxID=3151122 RepID=A0ABV1N0I5_9GAMM
MKKLLTFNTMVTPKIITIIYWLLCFGAVVGGIGLMFSGYRGPSAGTIFIGLVTIAGGILSARIWCELLIVLFKIHDNLKVIAERPHQ